MKLGFYYHVQLRSNGGKLYLPGYLAVFVEALAAEVDTLCLFLHEASPQDELCDTMIIAPNIQWVNLGRKTPAWHRELFHNQILGKVRWQLNQCDKILVRAPTPLAAHFHCYVDRKNIVYFVVGDYLAGSAEYLKGSLRNKLIYLYLHINAYLFNRKIQGANVIVNSIALQRKYHKIARNIAVVNTTTLTNQDFFQRCDSINLVNDLETKLLYTGRIVPEKGLEAIVEACHILINQGLNIKLHIAGFVVKGQEDYIEFLSHLAKTDSGNFLTYHGYKKVGCELNAIYRNSNIYILASESDFEGFPRTIWEAMANCLPVVATAVGSIPYFLKNEEHALIIPPKSTSYLVEAIKRLIEDADLRRYLIKNAFDLVKDITVEKQTKKLVDIIKGLK